MAGPGNIIGSPSQRGSGIIDLRQVQELIARIVAIEKQLKSKAVLIAQEVTLPNLPAGGLGKIKMSTPATEFDTEKWWNKANSEYVPLQAGTYLAGVHFSGTVAAAAGTFVDIGVGVNGTLLAFYQPTRLESSIAAVGVQGDWAGLFNLNGTTDNLEVFGNSTMAGHKGWVGFWAVYIP